MSDKNRASLSAERAALERMLAAIPPTQAIDRRTVQARMSAIDALIASAGSVAKSPARLAVTYRGKPVVGSHGIFAQFGTLATSTLAEAIAKLAAATSAPLASTGPLPNRAHCQVLITNTVLGSFGFELEEHVTGLPGLGDESAVGIAMAQAQEILRASLGDDDDLTEAVNEIDSRALAGVQEFLNVLVANEATCAIEHKGEVVRFSDVGIVRRSAMRLSEDNVTEKETTLVGRFRGFLPARRAFEFQQDANDEVVFGRVAGDLANAEEINAHLGQSIEVPATMRSVGKGKPRYLLKALPEWKSAR